MSDKTRKITNRVVLEYVLNKMIENGAPDGYADKVEAMLVQLDKKNAAPRKLSEKQIANASIADEIAGLLSDGVARTSGEIAKAIPALEGESPQKCAGILRSMFVAGRVRKETDKRKTYYSLA